MGDDVKAIVVAALAVVVLMVPSVVLGRWLRGAGGGQEES